MAPHLTAKELDIVAQAVGKRKNAGEVHRVIVARRLKERQAARQNEGESATSSPTLPAPWEAGE